MELRLKTWNSLNINDGTTFQAWISSGQLVNLSADGITVPRALDYPFVSTSVLPAHVLVIEVSIAPGQTINVKRELLKSYFNVMDTTKHNLVAEDIADSNRQWYVTGIPVRVVEIDTNAFAIQIQLEAPIWKLVTTGSDTWNITASAQTKAITNIGNINVKP